MRILILLVLILSGCTTVSFTPDGKMGTAIPYFINYRNNVICSKCKKNCSLYKIKKNKKIICDVCYRKYYQ